MDQVFYADDKCSKKVQTSVPGFHYLTIIEDTFFLEVFERKMNLKFMK